MNRFLGGLAACAALTMAASAHADVKWTVAGASYNYGAQVVNGYFIQKADSTIPDFSLTLSNGTTTLHYDSSNGYVDAIGSDNVDFQMSDNNSIFLVFDNDLLVENNPLYIDSGYVFSDAGANYNYTDSGLVGPRLGGSATGQVLAVPEPTTWALMLGGVFGAGAMARRRRGASLAV